MNLTQRTLPDNTQHSQQTDPHVPAGIRTRSPRKRADGDPRLRPRGHWDRLIIPLVATKLPYILESNPHPNLIRTSFCRFLKRKKKLVRGSSPHLSFNRPLRAAPSEVARWVSAAWKAIPQSIIFRYFKKCCINNALDESEDDILWEDNGEDKDESDWVTDSDSVMSDDGESDE